MTYISITFYLFVTAVLLLYYIVVLQIRCTSSMQIRCA